MNNFPAISEHNGQKAVSARELHSFLGSKKDFSNWIKHRIEKYGLVENVDYISFTQMGELNNQPFNPNPKIEYALTIDAAKELSMVEGNEKGKKARKYFIECERQSRSIRQLTPAEQLLESVKLTVEHERQISILNVKYNSLEQKIDSIIEVQKTNEEELKALPLSSDPVAEISLRDKIRLLVNRYCQATNVFQKTVWDNVYQTLYYNYHVPIKSYTKKKDESYLDVAERKDHLDKIYTIISNMVSNLKVA